MLEEKTEYRGLKNILKDILNEKAEVVSARKCKLKLNNKTIYIGLSYEDKDFYWYDGLKISDEEKELGVVKFPKRIKLFSEGSNKFLFRQVANREIWKLGINEDEKKEIKDKIYKLIREK